MALKKDIHNRKGTHTLPLASLQCEHTSFLTYAIFILRNSTRSTKSHIPHILRSASSSFLAPVSRQQPITTGTVAMQRLTVALCPASEIQCRLDSGHAWCSAHAVIGGHTTSYRPCTIVAMTFVSQPELALVKEKDFTGNMPDLIDAFFLEKLPIL